MNRYLRAIVRPEQDRIFRIGVLILYSLLVTISVMSLVNNAANGDWAWMLNLFSILFAIACTIFLFRVWANADDRSRERWQREVIPVTDPEDAADPFTYAMMRAFYAGVPSGIYRGSDGVWRDSETDEPIPVQESDGRTEPKDES